MLAPAADREIDAEQVFEGVTYTYEDDRLAYAEQRFVTLGLLRGAFRVDRDGVQIGHQILLVQWQDGKRVIVWPEELAPGSARFPPPPWSQRP